MKDKNIAMLTLAAALVAAIVSSVMAYKLNQASSQVEQLTSDPLGTLKKIF